MLLTRLASGMPGWPHPLIFQLEEGLIHHCAIFIATMTFFNETLGKCGEHSIVDLWGTKTPAFGLNGTGPDNYEEGLFKEQLVSIVMNHNTSQPLFLNLLRHTCTS